MKKPIFLSFFFTHSLLHADGFGTLFMSATLFILLLTLIIALTAHLKKLSKEKLRYRTSFQNAKTATLFIDAKGVIRDLNKSALTLSGYTLEQLKKKVWHDMLLPDEATVQIGQRLYPAGKREAVHTFNAPLTTADGNVLEAAFTLSPFPEPLKGYVLTIDVLH